MGGTVLVPYARPPTIPYSPPSKEAFNMDLANTQDIEAEEASSKICRPPFFWSVRPPLQHMQTDRRDSAGGRKRCK